MEERKTMNNNLPECCKCGKSKLEVSVGYTGADWNSKAGEGSGFGWEISLVCPSCGRGYIIGHLKRLEDFSEHIQE